MFFNILNNNMIIGIYESPETWFNHRWINVSDITGKGSKDRVDITSIFDLQEKVELLNPGQYLSFAEGVLPTNRFEARKLWYGYNVSRIRLMYETEEGKFRSVWTKDRAARELTDMHKATKTGIERLLDKAAKGEIVVSGFSLSIGSVKSYIPISAIIEGNEYAEFLKSPKAIEKHGSLVYRFRDYDKKSRIIIPSRSKYPDKHNPDNEQYEEHNVDFLNLPVNDETAGLKWFFADCNDEFVRNHRLSMRHVFPEVLFCVHIVAGYSLAYDYRERSSKELQEVDKKISDIEFAIKKGVSIEKKQELNEGLRQLNDTKERLRGSTRLLRGLTLDYRFFDDILLTQNFLDRRSVKVENGRLTALDEFDKEYAATMLYLLSVKNTNYETATIKNPRRSWIFYLEEPFDFTLQNLKFKITEEKAKSSEKAEKGKKDLFG